MAFKDWLEFRISRRPGHETQGRASDYLKVAASEGFLGGHSLLPHLACRTRVMLGSQFRGHGFQVDDETQTLNSGTIAMGAGGLVITGAADTSECNSMGKQGHTPAAGQYWKGSCKISSAAAATCGFFFGLCAVDTSPIASKPTDGAWLTCPNNSAALTGTVRGNSGTQSDITSFQTTARSVASGTPAAVSLVDATMMELGIEFFFGTTAALSWGNFWVNGFATPFTAAQLTQLFAILTTPPAMHRHIGLQGDGSARAVTVQFCLAEADR